MPAPDIMISVCCFHFGHSYLPFIQFRVNNNFLKVYSLSPEKSSETRERLNVVMIMEISRNVKRAYFRPLLENTELGF